MFLNLDENILRKAPEDLRRLMFRPPDIWSVNARRDHVKETDVDIMKYWVFKMDRDLC